MWWRLPEAEFDWLELLAVEAVLPPFLSLASLFLGLGVFGSPRFFYLADLG